VEMHTSGLVGGEVSRWRAPAGPAWTSRALSLPLFLLCSIMARQSSRPTTRRVGGIRSRN
jgi:hypothetical protein